MARLTRHGLLLAAATGCASAARAPASPASWSVGPGDADAAVIAVDATAAVYDGELRWLSSHLADDPDPTHPGDSPAVRRLAAYGAAGVRVVVEVFRVGDDHRGPFARGVVERVLRAHCRRDEGRIGRTRRWLFAPDADASTALWPLGYRWPLDRVERIRGWAEHDAPCEPEP